VTIQTSQLLNTELAASAIGVSTRRILQLVHADKLPAIAVMGRRYPQHVFRAEDVQAYAKARKQAKAK
jgi:excisionase family DNA binding protein